MTRPDVFRMERQCIILKILLEEEERNVVYGYHRRSEKTSETLAGLMEVI